MKTSAPLIAYHGDPLQKARYLARVRAHGKASEIVTGLVWENGRGSAAGCTVHSDRLEAYEAELGVPKVLAQLEDCVFEGLFSFGSPALALAYPERFLAAIKVGAGLSLVWPKVALWMLADGKYGMIRSSGTPRSASAIKDLAGLYQKWANGERPAMSTLRSAERGAAWIPGVAVYGAACIAAGDILIGCHLAASAYADIAAAPYKKARGEYNRNLADRLIAVLKNTR